MEAGPERGDHELCELALAAFMNIQVGVGTILTDRPTAWQG